MTDHLSPEILLQAYAAGIFPMAESRGSSEIHWVDPSRRGILPLQGFHMSRSLRKAIRSGKYEAKFDTDFEAVLRACSQRPETWINAEIHSVYIGLFEIGHAHSQEIWDGNQLIGGVYGVTLGKAFFGESMFSRRRDASKIALAWLIIRLQLTGFLLFDTQFVTPHLTSLGAVEISRRAYLEKLEHAVESKADITNLTGQITAQDVIQRNTQTS